MLHRLRLKSDDDTARTEVRQLLRTFRGRDDLYVSVAEQIDALRDALRPAPVSTTKTATRSDRNRFRSPVAMIDWLIILLGGLALLAGLVALFGSLYTTEDGSAGWGERGDLLRRWQLVVVLAVFAGLVALNFAGTQRVRKVTSLLALAVALSALVGWWWGAVSDLLAQTYISVGRIELGGGLIFTAISLGLQIAVGLLMFTAAFPSPPNGQPAARDERTLARSKSIDRCHPQAYRRRQNLQATEAMSAATDRGRHRRVETGPGAPRCRSDRVLRG